MSQHEGRNAAVRVLAALVLVISAVYFGTAHAASIGSGPAARQAEIIPICWHDQLSQYHCPDTSLSSVWSTEHSNIESVKLTITTRSGLPRTIVLPRGADAVFLSKSAVENFLVRYYDATATDKAVRVRAYVSSHSRPR